MWMVWEGSPIGARKKGIELKTPPILADNSFNSKLLDAREALCKEPVFRFRKASSRGPSFAGELAR